MAGSVQRVVTAVVFYVLVGWWGLVMLLVLLVMPLRSLLRSAGVLTAKKGRPGCPVCGQRLTKRTPDGKTTVSLHPQPCCLLSSLQPGKVYVRGASISTIDPSDDHRLLVFTIAEGMQTGQDLAKAVCGKWGPGRLTRPDRSPLDPADELSGLGSIVLTFRIKIGENTDPPLMHAPELGEHRHVRANGLRFHYVQNGSGPTLLLFLHGFPACWYTWHKALQHYGTSGKYTAVALDMRGYNRTDAPKGVSAYKVDALAADINAVVKALGFSNCILVGHDWGANVAWRVAHVYPEVVRRLVIANVPHPGAFKRNVSSSQLLKSWYIFFFQLPYLPEVFGPSMVRGAFRDAKVPEEEADLYVAAVADRPGSMTAVLNYYRAALFAPLSRPNRITAPTLQLWGVHDKFLGVELLKGTEWYFEAHSGHATFDESFVLDAATGRDGAKPPLLIQHLLPTAGHWCIDDNPEEVFARMDQFFALSYGSHLPPKKTE